MVFFFVLREIITTFAENRASLSNLKLYILIRNMFLAFVLLIISIVIITVFISMIYTGIKTTKESAKKTEKSKQVKLEKRKKYEAEFNDFKSELTEKYGKPDKIINFGSWKDCNMVWKHIIVFAPSSIITIGENILAFSDITSFQIVDNYQIEHGETIGALDTKTKTGSLIGRSVVGAAIGGGAGAIIGASSAAKSTSFISTQENDKLIHDYTLIIRTKDIKNPTIKFRMGEKWEKAADVEAILDIIVGQNRAI